MWYAQVCTNVEHIQQLHTRSCKDTHFKAQTPCGALVVFHTVRCGDYWCKIDGVYACALLKISKVHFVSFELIHVFLCLFLCPFSGFEANILFNFVLVLKFHALQSNQKENNTRGKRRYGIFLSVFNLISLKWAQSVVVFPHILQSMQRRKIVKLVNLGKEIQNERKWKEKKLGPCMNVFINFDLDTTLDLFSSKRMTSKMMKYWRNVNLKSSQ